MRSKVKVLCLVSVCLVLGLTGCTASETSTKEQSVAADKLEPLGEIQVVVLELLR